MSEQSDSKYLNVIGRIVGASGLGMFLSLALSVCLARLLGADGRGWLAAAQLLPTLLGGLATVGLPTAAPYLMRGKEGERGAIFVSGLFVVALASIAFVLIGELMLPVLIPGLSPESAASIRLYIVFGLPVTSLFIYLAGCGQIVADFRYFNLAKILPILLQVPVIAILVLVHGVTAEAVAFATIGVQWLVGFWLLGSMARDLGFDVRRMFGFVKPLVAYGVGVWAAEVLGTITLNADKLAITQSMPLRELGIYSVAYGLSRFASHLPNSVAAVIFPRNIGREPEEVVKHTGQAFRLSFWPMVVVAVPAAACCYPVFGAIFGRDFSLAGILFPILVLECLVSTGSWVLAQSFNALGKPQLIVWRQLFGLFAFIVMAAILVPRIGSIGVALSALTAGLVRLMATMLGFRAGLKVAPPHLMWQSQDQTLLSSTLSRVYSKFNIRKKV